MPRPGFYNDNEYRAYPFVYRTSWPTPALPASAIVDCGIIMGLDAYFDDAIDTVWLSSVQRISNIFRFTLSTGAVPNALVFEQSALLNEWAIVRSESVVADLECAEEPIWEGFLVTGPLTDLRAMLPGNGTISFAQDDYQLEPARIQNLHKAYLRSISVGNYDRIRVPGCNQTSNNDDRAIIVNARCLKGDVKLKEGYNCQITQVNRANEIVVSAAKGAGASYDSALCAAGSEIPLYDGEAIPAGSKFYSGGPACDELISTINGLGGPNVTIIGGAGIDVRVEDGQITVQKRPNTQVTCT